jgi:cytochrome P450
VFRRLVNRSFTPRAVAANDGMITGLAEQLVATMATASGRRADLHDAVAMPLPTTVIARLLGVEEDLLETFKRWSDAQVAGMGGGDQELRLQYQREMHRYFREQMARRHALVDAGSPLPDDLVSELVAASLDEERPITETELLSLLVQLLVGGNETTTSLITNCVWRLLADRTLWEQVVADPSLVEVAVEESLRYDPPVLGLYRNTTCPARLHDVEIPEHSKVMVLYASANRDLGVWDDPDAFRLDRDLTALRHHLSFGLGLHLCPGAALARLEATRALQALVTLVPSLALDGEVTRIEPFFLWGRRTLPVRW